MRVKGDEFGDEGMKCRGNKGEGNVEGERGGMGCNRR